MTDWSFEFSDRYVNRSQARAIYGDLADEYARQQLAGDPLADAVINQARAAGLNLHSLIGRSIEQGPTEVPDAPPALLALFAQLEEVPSWVDFDRINLGAQTYQRVGSATLLILSAYSLMNGYRCGPAVKPLAFTGQLEKRAPRRLAETSRFVTEVSQHDGLRRWSKGWRISVHVRLMHAMVRRMLQRSERWDTKAWGVPINQGDMVGTVIEFSLLWLDGARKMGFHFTRREADAVVHLWRYCGYLSGVDPTLLRHFTDEPTGVHFAKLLDMVQPGPDQDSIALADALRRVPQQTAKTNMQKRLSPYILRYHDGLTWVFTGDHISKSLGIPNHRWRHAIHPTRAFVAPLELARRVVPGANRFLARIGNRSVRAEVNRLLGGDEPSFKPVKRVKGVDSPAAAVAG